MKGNWDEVDFSEPEALILASNIEASRAFAGFYEGVIGEGGDCSQVDVSGLDVLNLLGNRVYQGNIAMLHESLPVITDSYRTLVRLNCPGVTVQ